MKKQEWNEGKDLWGRYVNRHVQDEMGPVDPLSEEAVDPARLRAGLEKAIEILDEMMESPEAFKAALLNDKVWSEALAQNPGLQAALDDPEKVQEDLEVLKEVRKDLQQQLRPRQFRKFVRDVRKAQKQYKAAVERQAQRTEGGRTG